MHTVNAERALPRKREAKRRYLAGLAWAKRIHASAKWRSTKNGTPFTITVDDIVIPERCPVLGMPLIIGLPRGSMLRDIPNSPSLDRIDNRLGYVPGNIIVVSYRANRIKCDATVAELQAVADFYRNLENGRTRESEGGGADAQVGRLPPAVPAMLTDAAEEKGPLPACHDAAGGDQGVLPSLQLGDDFR